MWKAKRTVKKDVSVTVSEWNGLHPTKMILSPLWRTLRRVWYMQREAYTGQAAKGQCCFLLDYSPPYFEPGFLTGPIVYLPLNALLLGYTTMLGFYMGAGDSNSNSYAFDMTK